MGAPRAARHCLGGAKHGLEVTHRPPLPRQEAGRRGRFGGRTTPANPAAEVPGTAARPTNMALLVIQIETGPPEQRVCRALQRADHRADAIKSHSVGLFLRSEAVEPPDLQREHRDQQSVGHRGSAPLRSAAVRPENGRDLWISPPKHAPQRNLPGSTRPRHGPLTTERTMPWTCERTRQLTRLARDG